MSTKPRKEIVLSGRAVSGGIARGKLSLWGRRWTAPPRRKVVEDKREGEVKRMEDAVRETAAELRRMRENFAAGGNEVQVELFEAHELLLQDLTVVNEVAMRIRQQGLRAESAFYEVLQGFIESMMKLQDDYMSARAIDIEDVGSRVLARMRGQADTRRFASQHDLDTVLLAWDMTPSDTAQLDAHRVRGFVTEAGSPNSHTAIIARAIGMPAVVGVEGLLRRAVTGREILVDGYAGKVILNPSEQTHAHYDELEREKERIAQELKALEHEPMRTSDGHEMVLSANLELEQEIARLGQSGAQGVGLYRTEFFFFEGMGVPSEEVQYQRYAKVARESGEHGVIIRTFDVGADKMVPEGELAGTEQEENPALGWRGIRVCLDRQELFRVQLRAILRAAAVGRVRVMFPMVSGLSQLMQARALLEECTADLVEEGVEHNADIEVGVMIEVPSAAIMADKLAQYVDFFSVGTNDLVQYTVAVDRTNEKVANLHQVCHPAVVRLLKSVVDAAHDAGIWVGICGEAAADLELTPLLVGLELDEFSVGISQVRAIKAAIRKLSLQDCKQLVAEVLEEESSSAILTASWAMADRLYPELL